MLGYSYRCTHTHTHTFFSPPPPPPPPPPPGAGGTLLWSLSRRTTSTPWRRMTSARRALRWTTLPRAQSPLYAANYSATSTVRPRKPRRMGPRTPAKPAPAVPPAPPWTLRTATRPPRLRRACRHPGRGPLELRRNMPAIRLFGGWWPNTRRPALPTRMTSPPLMPETLSRRTPSWRRQPSMLMQLGAHLVPRAPHLVPPANGPPNADPTSP